MPIEIEDWEKESGHYLDIGKKVLNIKSNAKYEISDISTEGVSLKEIPYFSNQKSAPLEISFLELLKAFTEEVFFIDGFEAGQTKELKIAISCLQKKVKMEEKDKVINDTKKQSHEKEVELSSIRAEKDLKKQQEEEKVTHRKHSASEMENKLIELELTLQ